MTRVIIALVLAGVLSLPAAATAAWPVFGHDLANSRSAGAEGPAPSQVAGLQRAWTFGSSHGDFTGTPVLAGGTLVAGTNLGSVYALDAATGAVRWQRDVGGPVDGSAAIDMRAPGGPTAFVPVARLGSPFLVALRLDSGAVRWRRVLTRQDGADVFGSPVLWRRTVYVGTSGPGNDQSRARGSVVALAEAGGRVRWRTYTVPPGHDGGGVWSTPSIDASSGRLYVGTGNAYHDPAAATTDSMLALSARSGRLLGHFQATAGDVWEIDDPAAGPDWDFGASPNLFAGPGGRSLVGEGQKSGIYWALDPTTMRPVWRTTVGPGSQADGGIGSTAAAGGRIYGSDSIDSQVFALGADGALRWNSLDAGPLHFSPVAVGNGVVYSADPAGFLTARDAGTGAVLAKLPLGGATFGGISIAGRAVYVAVGIGPPSPANPVPSLDLSQADGPGSIVAFGDTSQAPQGAGAATLSGSCTLSGAVHFQPALTTTPQEGRVVGALRGACSGSLTAPDGSTRSLDGQAAEASIASSGLESCEAGRGSGTGFLDIAGRRIGFAYDEVRTGPALALQVHGRDGGSAAAEGNVSTSADPVATLGACGGAGLTGAPVDVRLAGTVSG